MYILQGIINYIMTKLIKFEKKGVDFMKIRTKISISVIATALVSIFLVLGAILFYSAKDIKRDSEGIVIKLMEEEALKVENTLNEVKINVNNAENLILSTVNIERIRASQGELDNYENEIKPIFDGIMQLTPDKNLWIIGNTNDTKNIMALSVRMSEGKVVREEKYNVIGSAAEKDEWWQEPMKNGTNWSAPYQWDPWGPGTILMSYGKKVVKDGVTIGVVGSEFYFSKLRDSLSKIKIFKNGYLVLMDEELNFLYHPNEKLTKLSDVNEEVGNLFSKELLEKQEDKGIFRYKLDGKDKVLVYKRLSNGWIFGAAPLLDEMFVTLNRLRNLVIFLVILAIVVGIVISLIVSKTISTPIVAMEKEFRNLAQGNLNVSLKVSTKDEIGGLSENFNLFVEKISETLHNIIKLTKEVVESNALVTKSMDNLINGAESDYYNELRDKIDRGIIQLNHSISNVLDNVRNQTASSEESLAALEEISATSESINNSISLTNKSFEKTMKIASSSATNIVQMGKSMEEISISTKETNEEIEKLKTLSSDIGSILVAISSIAEQTNLLALNAAIEAARAGEAGRGFSVVADEIRKLAEQTNKETGKIDTLIKTIQNEVESVKNHSEEVNEKVKVGYDLSQIVQNNINEIIENNRKNAKEIQEIGVSVTEQSTASREITVAIGNIAESSGEIEQLSLATTEIADEVKENIIKNQKRLDSLGELTKQLEKDLSFFKL